MLHIDATVSTPCLDGGNREDVSRHTGTHTRPLSVAIVGGQSTGLWFWHRNTECVSQLCHFSEILTSLGVLWLLPRAVLRAGFAKEPLKPQPMLAFTWPR